MLYTLNLHNVVCQLHLKKAKKNTYTKSKTLLLQTYEKHEYVKTKF